MKSLSKSLDLLEYLFLNGDRAVQPLEISRALGISSPTCVRILQDFVSRGYAEQVSRSEGYRPGPMICTLSCCRNHYRRLAEACRQPLQTLSGTIHMQVNLAVLHSSGRIMLYYCGITSSWGRLRFDDHLDTATGRLLLSILPPAMRKNLPEGWSNGLDSEDGSIRFKGYPNLDIQGFLVRHPGYPDSAFGYGVPISQDTDRIFALGQQTRRDIIENLTTRNSPF